MPLPAPPPATTESYQAAVAAFVQSNCFTQWQSDPAPRLTGATTATGSTYSVHDKIKVYYSPDMITWMQANRPASGQGPESVSAIPDGAAMVAAVYPASGTPATPTGNLIMIRQAGGRPSQPASGWFFSQIVTDAANYGGTRVTASTGDYSLNLCIGCHSSALNNFTFAGSANLTSTPTPPPYTPSFQPQSTTSLQGQLTPPPSPQLRQRLGDTAAQDFINFFNTAVPEFQAKNLPAASQLPASSVVPIPPEATDDEYQHAGSSSFVTSNQCQSCHDANALLSVQSAGKPRTWAGPEMSFQAASAGAPPPVDKFNISQYGEWSVSIMALASRDPAFLSQAETERVLHDKVRPTSVDNFCYRCHGPMGQRQFHIDHGGDPTQSTKPLGDQPDFDHFMIYSTPGGCSSSSSFPCNQPGAQPANARYGGLARDGISCTLCHHMGVQSGAPSSDPWEAFYGFGNSAIANLELPVGIPYPFAGAFLYDLNTFVAPPADAFGNYVGKNPAEAQIWGHQQNFSNTSLKTPDFLSEGEFCGGCHVVIAPEIPKAYPEVRNKYQIHGETISPATYPGTNKPCPPVQAGSDGKFDPTQDPCVQQSYEQTTYLEWLASTNFGASDSGATCTGCHMPDARGQVMTIANTEGPGNTNGKGGFPKVPWRASDSALTLSSNSSYPRHRLMAINLFVHEMFQQNTDILGIADSDANVPADTVKNLQNAEETILTHAPSTVSLSVCAAGTAGTPCASMQQTPNTLTYQVEVTNLSGHRFPTGAGFRRGFLEFRLLDASDKTLWVSGAVNAQGAIVDQNGQVLSTEFPPNNALFTPSMLEPHFGSKANPAISQQNHVQIYEVRATDEYGHLTTATTRLFGGAKDNRIPPSGWLPPYDCKGNKTAGTGQAGTMIKGIDQFKLSRITAPEGIMDATTPVQITEDGAFSDPDYCTPNNLSSGSDHVLYRIPTTSAINASTVAKVSVVMHYQSTPPYFLRDRFVDGQTYAKPASEGGVAGLGAATERLLYVASHLNTNIDNSTTGPGQPRSQVAANWTMDIGSVCLAKPGSGTCPLAPPPAKSLKEFIDPNHRKRGVAK